MKFAPELPVITVTEVKSLNDVKRIAQDMKDNRASYVGIPWNGLNPFAMRVRGGEIEGRFYGIVSEACERYEHVIVKIGDFLVESANGRKTIVTDPQILGGNLAEVTWELFIPTRGNSLTGHR